MDDNKGRSTPLEYRDTAHIFDARGQLWSYSAPADVWRMRERPDISALVSLTSARSYQRLLAEFGPLTPYDRESMRS